jgi:hypothetical protein
MPIKVTGFQARPVATPIKYPPRPASGAIDTAALVLIDLQTNEGLRGTPTYSPFLKACLNQRSSASRLFVI